MIEDIIKIVVVILAIYGLYHLFIDLKGRYTERRFSELAFEPLKDFSKTYSNKVKANKVYLDEEERDFKPLKRALVENSEISPDLIQRYSSDKKMQIELFKILYGSNRVDIFPKHLLNRNSLVESKLTRQVYLNFDAIVKEIKHLGTKKAKLFFPKDKVGEYEVYWAEALQLDPEMNVKLGIISGPHFESDTVIPHFNDKITYMNHLKSPSLEDVWTNYIVEQNRHIREDE